MRYIDYVDLGYRPKRSDLVCDFYVEPCGISLKEAAGAVAAESSTGTWTQLTTEQAYVRRLGAKVFSVRGNDIRIAYPVELFESGNMANILSSVAGNVFGMRDLANLRLNDIHFPPKILRAYKGPRFGIAGIRKLLRVPKRPLIGTIIKPKMGLCTADHVRVAYNAWIGGCDIVKDDENLANQSFNRFEERVKQTLRAREKAERETGERKVYMANITAETGEMLRRAKFIKAHGGEYAMVDIITCGWSAMQTLRAADIGLVLHAHRAMHAAFTRNPKHGIAMSVVAKIARVVGFDQLHIGTVVGKMSESKAEVLANRDALIKPMGKLKPAFPVASGGLQPGLVPQLMKTFGNDNIILQFGGGIHGHPLGTRAGAMAVRQALDAALLKIPLKEYAKSHSELAVALEHWGAK
ncbi:MAG: type III ribulose-bisphosphate carboxylase [Candidatus Aenigmatarchaeota archaeon]